ncbi:hypothetical protein D3C78_1244730 [compost metagenome]
MTNEAHLRTLGERRGPGWYAGLFRLRVEHRRISRGATEQGPGIEADAFDTTIEQQTIEAPFGVALGKELIVTDFHGQGALQGVDEPRQLRQPIRGEGFGQLQPVRRDTLTQGAEQLQEGFGGRQALAQVTVVADVTGKLGGEAKVLGHDFGPALDRGRRRAGVEGRVAFHGIEHLGIEIQKVGAFRVLGIEIITPGVFAPGRTAQVVRQDHQM